MKKYFTGILLIWCLTIGNSVFWSSVCDIYKNGIFADNNMYRNCINEENYNNIIENYNQALQRQDYVQCITYLEKAKKYWRDLNDINNRIQNHAAYLCSAYAWKEEYKTAITYCKKSLAIYEEASVLYNAWFISYHLEDYTSATNYLNRAKKKALDADLNQQIDNLIESVKIAKEYATLKKTRKTNDPYWYYQYYLQWINIFDAWDKLPKKKNEVLIAVIDDWININHPEFKNKIWINEEEIPGNWIDDDRNWYIDDFNWRDFVNSTNNTKPSESHGTYVAWVIASSTNNNAWIAWVVPEVKIMNLNVFWSNTKAWDSKIIEAIEYAIDKWANIINLSLWWTQFTYSNIYDKVFKKAYEKGIIIIVSAGNWDVLSHEAWVNTTINKISPVCNETDTKMVFWVWALSKQWSRANWSNYWSCVDFYMYWEDIYTTSINADWEPYAHTQWTSLSAPIVAWIVGLWFNKYGKLKPDIVYNNLKNSLSGNVIDAAKYLDNISLSQGELKDAINWLIKNNFTKATNIGGYKYNKTLTRAEASKFFVNYAKLFNKDIIVNDSSACEFSDINEAPADLRAYIVTACRYGLLGWSKGKFKPYSNLTNAQAITVFMRMYSWKKDESWKHFADRYFIEAYSLWLIDWTLMWNQNNYERWVTRGDIAILLYRWSQLNE